MKTVTIYTDGSGRTWPNRGGSAAVLECEGKEMEKKRHLPRATNNTAEIIGAIIALRALKKPCIAVVHCDSEYVVKGFTEGRAEKWARRDWYRKPGMVLDTRRPSKFGGDYGTVVQVAPKRPHANRVSNWRLWRLLKALVDRPGYRISFVHVRGHAKIEGNERCDVLANQARKEPSLRLRLAETPVAKPLVQSAIPSAEDEPERHKGWLQARLDRIRTARKAIIEHCHDRKGVTGRIDCPVCGQAATLGYRRAGNGHIAARCDTPDCVLWME